MKNKKTIHIAGLSIGLVLILLFFVNFIKTRSPQGETSSTEIKSSLESIPGTQKTNKAQSEQAINLASVTDSKEGEVTLKVLDKTYTTEGKEGETVFGVMNKIASEGIKNNLFNYKYIEHAGWGVFVTEINGVKGSSGKYWIYYVNGKEASVGISKYIIKSGDIITWKQE